MTPDGEFGDPAYVISDTTVESKYTYFIFCVHNCVSNVMLDISRYLDTLAPHKYNRGEMLHFPIIAVVNH